MREARRNSKHAARRTIQAVRDPKESVKPHLSPRSWWLAVASFALPVLLFAQGQFRPGSIQRLPSKEVSLQFIGEAEFNYRIDVSSNLTQWNGLVTLPGSALQYTDAAATGHQQRFYRALAASADSLTGDHLNTADSVLPVPPVSVVGGRAAVPRRQESGRSGSSALPL